MGHDQRVLVLDRHATALRKHRAAATAAMTAQTVSEGAKLIGWQIADTFGAVPEGTRRHWHTAGDERVRHTHAQVPRMNPGGVGLREAFYTPLGLTMIPPLEINCRCRVHVKSPTP